MYQLTGAIVLYNNDPGTLLATINSFLDTDLNVRLYLIDNSPNDKLRGIVEDARVEYIYNNSNLGFGKAHNIAIENCFSRSQYHLVLNPDIKFDGEILTHLYNYMEANHDIGQIMPKIFYENGELQRLCKLLPAPRDLFGRRFFPDSKWANERNREYELQDFAYDRILDVPNLSGCFMFIRTSVLQKSGLFDPRYFMYMEDVDLTRRIGRVARTVFYPYVSIIHGYQKESYNNRRLMRFHITSAIKYFNKWGWLMDSERKTANRKVTMELRGRQ
jgi:GT2 family glycosyltransferase